MQWVWISSPHNPHSITKYIQALAPSNNWLVVKDLIADRAVIIGQGGSLGWTLYNCINGCCYAVYQADMRGTLPATVHFHPEREEWIRDGGGTDRDKTQVWVNEFIPLQWQWPGQYRVQLQHSPTSAPGLEIVLEKVPSEGS